MWQALKDLATRAPRRKRRRPSPTRPLTARLSGRVPQIYVAMSAALAALGYLWLLAFPLLAIYCLVDLPETLMAADTAAGWAWLGAEALACLFGAVVTFVLLRLKVQVGRGVEVHRPEAPALFEQLDTLCGTYGAAPAHRVALNGEMAIAMDYIPVNGFPFASRRHLYIGLPLLAALDPEHAKAALGRAVGRSSLRNNRVTGWLHRLHVMWGHYLRAYRCQPRAARWLLQTCFWPYARSFTALSRYAVQRDELEGDVYALDIVNDQAVAELIGALSVYPRLLDEHFWPPFQRLAHKHAKPPMAPFARLLQMLPTLLQRRDLQRWLTEAMTSPQSGRPALAERLDNIGHTRPRLPGAAQGLADRAAPALLGESLSDLCSRLDQAWLREHAAHWQRRHAKYRHERAVLKDLNERARRGGLEPREAWQHARLVARHLGRRAAAPLFKRLAAQTDADPRRLLEAGRVLLQCADPAGIAALEQAMARDARCRDQAIRLIAAYRGAQAAATTDAAMGSAHAA